MTSLDPFSPGRKMTGVYPDPSQRGLFHFHKHPVGQREKTRKRGPLWAGKDFKMDQQRPAAESRCCHQMERTTVVGTHEAQIVRRTRGALPSQIKVQKNDVADQQLALWT